MADRSNLQTLRNELDDWLRFLRADSHILKERPQLFFQQAANQPDSAAPSIAAKRRWETRAERRQWIQWINKPKVRDACILTLAGHSREVQACAFSPDG